MTHIGKEFGFRQIRRFRIQHRSLGQVGRLLSLQAGLFEFVTLCRQFSICFAKLLIALFLRRDICRQQIPQDAVIILSKRTSD